MGIRLWSYESLGLETHSKWAAGNKSMRLDEVIKGVNADRGGKQTKGRARGYSDFRRLGRRGRTSKRECEGLAVRQEENYGNVMFWMQVKCFLGGRSDQLNEFLLTGYGAKD